MCPNPQFADLVIFTEEILIGEILENFSLYAVSMSKKFEYSENNKYIVSKE